MTTRRVFWILTITVFAGLLIPSLVQNGMFVDGVTYGAISRNMAQGIGDFLNPHYTKTLYPEFHEHPPLVFILQSFFFMVLGDGIYTERIFSFFNAVLSAWGIVLLWRLFNKNNDQKDYDWLPVLLWITVPLVFWSYSNNLLENSVSAFVLFAVWFIAKSCLEDRIIYLLPGSLLIFLAFLSKGVVGLFPLVTPLCFGLAFRGKSYKKFVLCNSYLILLAALLFFMVFKLIPGLESNIKSYFSQQLIPSLTNRKEITTGNRFFILWSLVPELVFPLLFLFYFLVNEWLKTKKLSLPRDRSYLFFLFIALAASVPLVVTLKQRKFYLVPSIPFYVLTVSALIIPFLKKTMAGLSPSALKRVEKISMIAFGVVILVAVLRFGKYSRDEEEIRDVYRISETIPRGSVVGTTKDLGSDWKFVAYLCRIGYISLDPDKNKRHQYFILEKKDVIPADVLKDYEKTDLKLQNYTVLKKTE